MEYLNKFQGVWKAVREQYSLGSCVSEPGLQALLYAELRQAFPEKKIVVEPRWRGDNRDYVPDIAMVRNNFVTDVFEIKFKPHYYADFEEDIRKLILYGTGLTKCETSIDPLTGQWKTPLMTAEGLRRHFVAVARNQSEAVWAKSILHRVPQLSGHMVSFYHWFGRTGRGEAPSLEWDVQVGAPESAESLQGELG